MLKFYRSLSATEKRSASVLGRFTLLMFTVPAVIAMTLPALIRYLGLDRTASLAISACVATVSVLIIAISFGYLAYCEDNGNGESQARFIMGKSTKSD